MTATPPPNDPYESTGGTPGGYPGAPAYSGSNDYAERPAAGPRPKSMDLVVKLLYAGAVVSLLTLVGISESLDAYEQAATDLGTEVSDSSRNGALFGIIASSVVFAGLWIASAQLNGRGISWARIVGTVLGALNILRSLFSFVEPTPVAATLSAVTIVLSGVILFLLWRPESSAFYASRSTPKY